MKITSKTLDPRLSEFWQVKLENWNEPRIGKVRIAQSYFPDDKNYSIRYLLFRPTQLPKDAIEIDTNDLEVLSAVPFHVQHFGKQFEFFTKDDVHSHNIKILEKFVAPYRPEGFLTNRFDVEQMAKRIFSDRIIVEVYIVQNHVIALCREDKMHLNWYGTDRNDTSYCVLTTDSHMSHRKFEDAAIEAILGGHTQYNLAMSVLVQAAKGMNDER